MLVFAPTAGTERLSYNRPAVYKFQIAHNLTPQQTTNQNARDMGRKGLVCLVLVAA